MRKLRLPTAKSLAPLFWVLLCILVGELVVLHHDQSAPVRPTNLAIARAAQNSAVHTLYVPLTHINQPLAPNSPALRIVPIAHCLPYRQTTDSFAVLAGRQGACPLAAATQAYGLPAQTVLLGSGQMAFTQTLVIYKHVFKPRTYNAHYLLDAMRSSVQADSCQGHTTMNIVAHEDDDILFMNPDLMHSVRTHCTVSVYLTAGDDGLGKRYWQARQAGAEAAYSRMYHAANKWHNTQLILGENQVVQAATLERSGRATLVFMHLPDGNLDGSGFERTYFQSLLVLRIHSTDKITATDNQASYTSHSLIDALSLLITYFQPTAVRTQSFLDGPDGGDHSDHQMTALYAKDAFDQLHREGLLPKTAITFYVGYRIRGLASNVPAAETLQKANIFMTYARYDSDLCITLEECDTASYNDYFTRQYSYTEGDILPAQSNEPTF